VGDTGRIGVSSDLPTFLFLLATVVTVLFLETVSAILSSTVFVVELKIGGLLMGGSALLSICCPSIITGVRSTGEDALCMGVGLPEGGGI
jgi:hypothetical protein